MARLRAGTAPSATIPTVVAAVAALHVALLYAGRVPALRHLSGDEGVYVAAAKSLLAGEGLRLDRLWPPLYAYLVAATMWLGGPPYLLLQLVQTAMLAATAVAVHAIAMALFGSRLAASVAAFATAAYPTLVSFCHFVRPEVAGLLCFFAPMALLMTSEPRPARAAAAGAIFALGLLTRLVALPFAPVVAWPLLRRGGRAGAASALAFLMTVAAGIAGLAPFLRPAGPVASPTLTVAFNVVLGIDDVSRRSFGDEVAGALFRDYLSSGDSPREREAALWEEAALRWREQGPVRLLAGQLAKQPFRFLDPESFLTAQIPGGSLYARGRRYSGFSEGAATALRAVCYALHAVLLAATVLGAFALPWRSLTPWQRSWLAVLCSFVSYNLALYVPLHTISRYQVPLLPILFLFAAALLRLPCDGESERAWSVRVLGAGTLARTLRVLAVLAVLLAAFAPAWGLVEAREL